MTHEQIWEKVHRIVGDWPLEEVDDLDKIDFATTVYDETYYVQDIQAIKHGVYDLIADDTYDDFETIVDVLDHLDIEWK